MAYDRGNAEQRNQTQKMNWTDEHNNMLCREVLVVEPYKFKIGSRERGACWEKVANNLNGIEHPLFIVDKRAVRDHVLKLIRDFKRKMAAEEKASGITKEMSELDEAIESIIGRMEGAEEEISQADKSRCKEVEREREAAENIRKRAMESIGESRERETSEGGFKRNRMERKMDTAVYLKERHDEEVNLRKAEVDLREREIQLREKEQEQNYELKKQELALKEREREDKVKEFLIMEQRETKLLNLIQQQQLLFSQISQQNVQILNLLKNLTEK
ncbi:DNA ligase 1-like [Rhopilema esculentum]|uniref:DNA ligase 1-like n=1 Tax=Rhopilema esculentum TaxID=499914 RepID=UPI0031DE0CEC